MASAPQQKHSEAEFGNWVKCCIGLRYFKDGLKPFVDSEIEHQHRSIVKTIFRQFETALVHCEQSHEQPGKCVSHNIKVNCDTCSQSHCASRLSQHAGPCSFKQCGRCKDNFCRNCKLSTHVMADCDCTVKSILPAHDKDSCQYKKCNCKKPHSRNTKLCKNNWCGHFYNEVQNLHMFGDPLFANSNTQVWKKNPWEFAKCFLNCGGQLTTQSSDDIDAAGLISICRNNKYFQTRLNDLRRLDEVREFRNVVFHSATQSVTEEDKCKFVDTIICILEGETCLKDTLAAKKACGKVKHLNTLKIQIEDPLVVNARSEAIQAILQDQREIQACIAELRESSHSSDKERIETLQQNLFEFGNLLGRHALELSTVKREIQVIQTDLHHTKKRLTDVEEQLGAALLFIEDIQNRCPDVNGIKSNTRIIVEADQTTVTAEQSRHISDVLLEDCQRFIKKDSKTLKPSSGLNTREFYTDVEDGGHAKIKDARNKCLSLEIQCFTVESFIKLLKKCVSGALTQRFKPIRDELRKLTQCSKLEMEVFIYEEDAIATLEQIVFTMNMTLASDIEQQCLLENDKGLVQYQSSIAKPTEIKSDQAITKKEAENVTQEDVHRTTFENCEQDEDKRTRKCSGTEEAHASYKECVKQHKTELSLFEQLKKTDVKETDDRSKYPSILREACAHHPAKLVEMYYKIHNQVESDTGMAEKHKELLLLACCKLASGDDEVPDVEFSSEEYNGHFCYVCERKTIKKAAENYCVSCQDYYCQKCVKIHYDVPSLSKHFILGKLHLKSVSSIPRLPSISTEICTNHPKNIVDRYCETHDEVGCKTCMATKHDESCAKLYIPENIDLLFDIEYMKRTEQQLRTAIHKVEVAISVRDGCLDEAKKIKDVKGMQICTEIESVLSKQTAYLEKELADAKNVLQKTTRANSGSNSKIQHFIRSNMAAMVARTCEDAKISLDSPDEHEVSFQPHVSCEELLGLLVECNSIGEFSLLPSRKQCDHHKIVMKEKTSIQVSSDKKMCWVPGSCTTQDGTILLADANNSSLKRISTRATSVSNLPLPGGPWSVTAINENEAAVTLPDQRQVQIIALRTKMETTRTLKLDFDCRAVTHYNNELFISDKNTVYVYTVTGKPLRKLGQTLFSYIYNMAVSKINCVLLVVDWHIGLIAMERESGDQLWCYHGGDRWGSIGVCVDGSGGVFVCGCRSHNILQISENGEKMGEIVTRADGIVDPRSVCFIANTSTLVVTQYSNDIMLYQLTK